MARLVKFGDVKRKAFLEALGKGAGRGASAESVGVTYETIRLHMHKDPTFHAAIDEAEMNGDDLRVQQVEGALFKAAMDGNVTACQVWLYNRKPDKWADKRNIKIAGDPDHPLDIRMMSDDELKRHTANLANRIARYIGGEFSDNGDGG